MSSAFVEIAWRERRVRIEHAFVGSKSVDAPLIVFLHEGLGSLSMWRDFPQQLVAGRMPERVVDSLEAVEVDQQQSKAAQSRSLVDALAQPLLQQVAVSEAGQRVVIGTMRELFLQPCP